MPRLRPLALALALLACLAAPAAARADAYVSGFSLAPASTAAGVHTQVDVEATFASGDPVRDLHIHLPPGLVGNPRAVPACPQADFANDDCDPSTRVGTTSVDTITTILLLPTSVSASGYVYNVAPNADEPARLGAIVTADLPIIGGLAKIVLPVTVALRPDGGLDTTISDIPTTAAGLPTTVTGMTLHLGDGAAGFMTTPTSCGRATTRIDAVTRGGATHSASSSFTPTNCAAVPFTPRAGIDVANHARVRPSGYTVSLQIPDGGNPRQSHVRRAHVVLPEGTTLSPGVAAGLQACTPAQFGAPGAPARCPAASQIGSVSFATPLIGTLHGSVYFGRPAGGAYPLLVAVDDHGVRIKLTGTVTLDPATGRITTVFAGLPQVPFTDFQLTFQGGDRAVLANPATCGTKTLTATLTPWSGTAARTATASFAVTGCPSPIPFRPALRVSSDSTRAGRPAGALAITISRPDGDQDIVRAETLLPPGLAASLTGVPACPEAAARTGACPAQSRLGAVAALVGSGGAPVALHGSVYLTGPAEGGLAGLAIVLPGRVGPVDLGTVVVRAGLLLRPSDGGVTVRTAPLPSIVGGVPVSIRSLTLRLDRPGFTVNPSGCDLRQVRAVLTGSGGARATAAAPYRATDCAGLPFAPRLRAWVNARGPKHERNKPALHTAIAVPPGNASTAVTKVTLPERIGVDAAHLGTICSGEQAAADACPAASRVGSVTAVTPLLPVPLTGPVQMSVVPGSLLPGVRLALGGPVQLRLDGTLDLAKQGVSALFAGIPDVPLSRLRLTFDGGGPLKMLGDPCTGGRLHLGAELTGHNGATAAPSTRVKVHHCRIRGTARAGHGPHARLRIRKGRDTRPLRRVRVTGLHRVAARRIAASADRHRLGRRAVRVHRHTLLLRLHGARAIGIRIPAAALHGRLRIEGTRTNGHRSTARMKVRGLR